MKKLYARLIPWLTRPALSCGEAGTNLPSALLKPWARYMVASIALSVLSSCATAAIVEWLLGHPMDWLVSGINAAIVITVIRGLFVLFDQGRQLEDKPPVSEDE
ncbi:hypothetical protein [Cupriavidus basilensis]